LKGRENAGDPALDADRGLERRSDWRKTRSYVADRREDSINKEKSLTANCFKTQEQRPGKRRRNNMDSVEGTERKGQM